MIKLLGLILWSHSVCVCVFPHLSPANFMELDRDPVCECLLPTNQKWVAIIPELGSNGTVVTTQLRSNGIRLYLWPFDLKWYHYRPPPTNRSQEYGCDTNADITNQLVITGYFCPSSTVFFLKILALTWMHTGCHLAFCSVLLNRSSVSHRESLSHCLGGKQSFASFCPARRHPLLPRSLALCFV